MSYGQAEVEVLHPAGVSKNGVEREHSGQGKVNIQCKLTSGK